jgi:hypothetical protein
MALTKGIAERRCCGVGVAHSSLPGELTATSPWWVMVLLLPMGAALIAMRGSVERYLFRQARSLGYEHQSAQTYAARMATSSVLMDIRPPLQ